MRSFTTLPGKSIATSPFGWHYYKAIIGRLFASVAKLTQWRSDLAQNEAKSDDRETKSIQVIRYIDYYCITHLVMLPKFQEAEVQVQSIISSTYVFMCKTWVAKCKASGTVQKTIRNVSYPVISNCRLRWHLCHSPTHLKKFRVLVHLLWTLPDDKITRKTPVSMQSFCDSIRTRRFEMTLAIGLVVASVAKMTLQTYAISQWY